MEEERVWVNWTSSLSPLSNANVGLPCRRISWQQIRIRNLWFESFGWNESFSCHFNENVESVVSHTFSNETCSIRNVLWSPAQRTMGWYAFECKARQAAQVMRNRLSHYGEVSLCYITQALRGHIGHGNETEENRRARLCAKLKCFRTHMHTPLHQFLNRIKVAWFTILFDFIQCFHLTYSVHFTPHHTSSQLTRM